MDAYILVDKMPIKVSMEELTQACATGSGFDIERRRVAWTDLPDPTVGDGFINVSTVFLTWDHNHMGYGDPVLFETMVFGGLWDQYCWRYCSWEAAEQGHKIVVDAMVAGKQMDDIADEMMALERGGF